MSIEFGDKRLPENFWSKVLIVAPNDCWLWTGAGVNSGTRYGRFRWFDPDRPHLESAMWLAHRFSYTRLIGNIPNEMQIDHLCQVRHCVNPLHLRVLSLEENVLCGTGLSAKNKAKTHCKYGHPLSGDNVLTYIGSNSKKPARACKTCNRDRAREAYYDGRARR